MDDTVQQGPTVVAKRWTAVCMDLEPVFGPRVLWDTPHPTHTHVSRGALADTQSLVTTTHSSTCSQGNPP